MAGKAGGPNGSSRLLGAVLVSVLTTALLASVPGASAPWVIESSDGGSSIKLGFLAQPQAESCWYRSRTPALKNRGARAAPGRGMID